MKYFSELFFFYIIKKYNKYFTIYKINTESGISYEYYKSLEYFQVFLDSNITSNKYILNILIIFYIYYREIILDIFISNSKTKFNFINQIYFFSEFYFRIIFENIPNYNSILFFSIYLFYYEYLFNNKLFIYFINIDNLFDEI